MCSSKISNISEIQQNRILELGSMHKLMQNNNLKWLTDVYMAMANRSKWFKVANDHQLDWIFFGFVQMKTQWRNVFGSKSTPSTQPCEPL